MNSRLRGLQEGASRFRQAEREKMNEKQTIEQLNIWYSPSSGQWLTCAMIVLAGQGVDRTYKKERVAHRSLDAALEFCSLQYVGVYT